MDHRARARVVSRLRQAVRFDGIGRLDVSTPLWLVMESNKAFPVALQELSIKAFGEWFPANPYQSIPGPEMVVTDFADGAHSMVATDCGFQASRRLPNLLPPSLSICEIQPDLRISRKTLAN